MSSSKRNAKRTSSSPLPLETSTRTNTLNGLFECYNFLSPNEYSEKAFGILAFLLRKSAGDINFSDIMDEVEKRSQHGQKVDYVTLLEDRRKSLVENDASIEKCLMINRLISYINENEAVVLPLISQIRNDMKLKLTDYHINQNINYPDDFRQRENDFRRRMSAQEIRRLFFCNHTELKQPPSLIHLINRTTEHLNYIIDCKMKYDPQFREAGLKELERIFNSSFMVISQPHYNSNPVLVYERRGSSGQCTAKVSVIIVSLLYDFMRTHPNVIELFDIEPNLHPISNAYKLEPLSIPWKTCCLQIDPNERPCVIQYAEVSMLTIRYSTKTSARVHLCDDLYTLAFPIRFRLNLKEYGFSKAYQNLLETSKFAIVSHNGYIPHCLTKVILHDIQKNIQNTSNTVHAIVIYMLRYFSHRTGVLSDNSLKNYLENELNRAKNEKRNSLTMEDTFMDFLVPFVNQVEFMAKHPIIAMFYADSLCLGICDSTLAAETMKKSMATNLPMVCLRLNSIKVDYKANASTATAAKTFKSASSAIRVDIINNSTKKIQNRTFDTTVLSAEIKKFVCTAHTENGSHIRILSNLNDLANTVNYKSFNDFDKYYHDRLMIIDKMDEAYKPIKDIIHDVQDYDDSGGLSDSSENPNSEPSSTRQSISEPHSNPPNMNDGYSTAWPHCSVNTAPLPTMIFTTPSQQLPQFQNTQDLVQYIFSHRELLQEILSQLGSLHITSPAIQTQQYPNPTVPLPSQSTPFIMVPVPQQSYQPPIYPASYQQQLGYMQYPPQPVTNNQQFFQQPLSFPLTIDQTHYQPRCQISPINNTPTTHQESSIENQTPEGYTDILKFLAESSTNDDQMESVVTDDGFELWDI